MIRPPPILPFFPHRPLSHFVFPRRRGVGPAETAAPRPPTKDLPNLFPRQPARPFPTWLKREPRTERPMPTAASPATSPAPTSSPSPRQSPPPAESASVAVPLLKVPLRLIGVIGKLYVVLESDRGLVLMDQHAAHERILYEQMLRRLEQGDAPSQRLVLPETVELSARDAEFLRDHLPVLARLGVGLSEFGERTFLLDAL